MRCLFSLLARLLLAAAFAASALWMVVEAIPAAHAVKLQQEFPPITRHLLTAEARAELLQQMAAATRGGTPCLVFRAPMPELGVLLQTAGLSPDAAGYVALMTEPIDTGDARMDFLQSSIRASLGRSADSRFCVSEDGNMAVYFFNNEVRATDVFENTPEGIRNTLMLLGSLK